MNWNINSKTMVFIVLLLLVAMGITVTADTIRISSAANKETPQLKGIEIVPSPVSTPAENNNAGNRIQSQDRIHSLVWKPTPYTWGNRSKQSNFQLLGGNSIVDIIVDIKPLITIQPTPKLYQPTPRHLFNT